MPKVKKIKTQGVPFWVLRVGGYMRRPLRARFQKAVSKRALPRRGARSYAPQVLAEWR
jgi:hypothetical protein